MVGGVIFGRFSNVDNFRLEVRSDDISGVVVDPVSVKVSVKLGDSRSKLFSRYTTASLCTNDDAGVRRSSHKNESSEPYAPLG